MSPAASVMFFIALFGGLLTMILFVLFGQLTVRRLRKKAELKGNLGVEFASGWDIINTAQALALPFKWSKKLADGPLGAFYADPEILYRHTSRFDRALGASFYWFLNFTALATILMMLVEFLSTGSL